MSTLSPAPTYIHTKSNKEINHLLRPPGNRGFESVSARRLRTRSVRVRVSGGCFLAVPQFLGVSLIPTNCTKVGDLVAASGSGT